MDHKDTNFFQNISRSLDNFAGGYSLRKLLAVGFFGLAAYVTIRYTDKDNMVAVLTILTGMVTALAVTYTVGNHHEKKLNQPTPPVNEP